MMPRVGSYMYVPDEVFHDPDATALIGDIDAFMAYYESGQAAKDWEERMAYRMRELDWL